MNPIALLLPEDHVLLALDASSKKRIFEEAGRCLEASCGIDHALVFDNLLTREKLGSTGLGQGVAIPHGRVKGLKTTLGAFIRPLQPIDFDAPDGQPVQLIFVLLAPEQATEESLQILAALATCFAEHDFREKLLAAPDAACVREIFASVNV
jgi:PTS system nitrogen regulatory IIA component